MNALPSTVCALLALAAPATAQTDWSTVFGLAGRDSLTDMKTDAAGRVYICGSTDAPTHVTAGAFQPGLAGGVDAFVACLDPNLPTAQQLVWSTHFGGAGDDTAVALHVDPNGTRVTVVGTTSSNDFPVTSGASFAGGSDAFVVVFDPAATGAAQLSWSTLLGGSADDVASGVDVFQGTVGVVGTTESANLPVLGAAQPNLGGGRDLFVAAFLPGGTPQFTTYLGGSGEEGRDQWGVNSVFTLRRARLAYDPQGRATVTGNTDSANYPRNATHGPRGRWDIAVTRFDAQGQVLRSTVLGGSHIEYVYGIRCDGNDRVILSAGSRSNDFPVTSNTFASYQRDVDGVVVHYDVTNDQLLYSTLIGGSGQDNVMSAYREPSGTFVLAMHVRSSNMSGTPGCPQIRATAVGQVYMARIRPDATSTTLQYGTFYGGTQAQMVLAMEPDHRGGAVVAGATLSTNFPTTAGAFDQLHDGSREGWVSVHRMLPANVDRFGRATSPCGQPTWLQMGSAPLADNASWTIETHGAPAGAAGALFFGAPLPSGFALAGIDVFVGAGAIASPTITADATGYASLSLALPAGFAWNGSLALQSVWLNPTACGGSALTASNALR